MSDRLRRLPPAMETATQPSLAPSAHAPAGNSLSLLVTRISRAATACAAIHKSLFPIISPFDSSSARILPTQSFKLEEGQHGIVGSEDSSSPGNR